jgi:predicted amidohydrolase YtcJ
LSEVQPLGARLISAGVVRTAAGVLGNAVLVEAGRVVAIGDRSHLREAGLAEERFPGAVLIPGLRDAHMHPVPYAATLAGITLKEARDVADLQQRLREAASRSASHGPLLGFRFDDESLAERRIPTRDDIDAAVSDRPVLLKRYCGHIAVANSVALATAGLDSSTPDPAGGRIDRDPNGDPNGILRETAIDLVATRLDASELVTPGDLAASLRGLAGLGLTSIGAILGLGNGPWASLGDEVTTMLAIAHQLPIRVHALVVATNTGALTDAASRLTGVGPRLRWLGLKRFADGSFGGHTAAMFSGYSDRPDELGTLRLNESDETIAQAALEHGGRVAVHAIGDRACGAVLDLFERLIARGTDPRRLRIEHASLLAADDLTRIGELGVTACVQPAFLGSETTWLERRVGRDRLSRTYPFATLERNGAHLAGSSDCPVEPPHPLWGMALARDRAGIVMSEALPPERALALFTTGAAFALGEPEPLSIGSPADLVALDRDPVTCTPDELRDAEILETWVDGEAVIVDRDRPVWLG